MSMQKSKFTYDIFVSYSRRDNIPRDSDTLGWVTEFCHALAQEYRQETDVDLRLFFDKHSIEAGADWKERLGDGIRQSHLFLAFLSDNYFESTNTLWEWERYLSLEHGAARGNDGVIQIFFIAPERLEYYDELDDPSDLTTSSDDYGHRPAKGEQANSYQKKLSSFKSDLLGRRNRTEMLDLSPWHEAGPAALRAEDAKLRAQEFNPPTRSLPTRVRQISAHCAQRLARVALAESAPSNIARAHEHFVGRHGKLRRIHETMLAGSNDTGDKGRSGGAAIACLHGLGGTGKSALARQYAHAYAEFYVIGGIWEIDCEGNTDLLDAIQSLSDSAPFCQFLTEAGTEISNHKDNATTRSDISDATTIGYAESIYSKIDKAMELRASDSRINELAMHRPAKCLLILDNVDQATLLTSRQLAQLPMGGWIDYIVTTRINPMLLGFGERWATAIEIAELHESEAVQLLEEHLPNRRFQNDKEAQAASKLVERLGNWALAVDLAGAYIGSLYNSGLTFGEYLQSLENDNDTPARLTSLGESKYGSSRIRHAEPNIGTIIDWSIAKLDDRSFEFLAISAYMNTNKVPINWVWSIIDERCTVEVPANEAVTNFKADRIERIEAIASLSAFHLVSHTANDGNSDSIGHLRLHKIVAEYIRKRATNHGVGARSATAHFFQNRLKTSRIDDLLTLGMNLHLQLIENLFSVIKSTLSENEDDLSADLIKGISSIVATGLHHSHSLTRPVEVCSELLILMNTLKGWGRNQHNFPSGYFSLELTLQRARLARLQGSDFYDALSDMNEMYIYILTKGDNDWASSRVSRDDNWSNRHQSISVNTILEFFVLRASSLLIRGGPEDLRLCKMAANRYLSMARAFHGMLKENSASEKVDVGNVKRFALFLARQGEPDIGEIAVDLAELADELDKMQVSTPVADDEINSNNPRTETIRSLVRTSVRYVRFDPRKPFGDFKLVTEQPEPSRHFPVRSDSAIRINTCLKNAHKAVLSYFDNPCNGLKDASMNYRLALDLLETEWQYKQKQEDCTLSYVGQLDNIFEKFPLIIDCDDSKGWTPLLVYWLTSSLTVLHNREAWDQFSVSVQIKAKIHFRLGFLLHVNGIGGNKTLNAKILFSVASKLFARVYQVQQSSLAKRRNLIVSTRRYIIAATSDRLKGDISTLDESIEVLSERWAQSKASSPDDWKTDRSALKQRLFDYLLLAELLHHRATMRFDKHGLLFIGKPWTVSDPSMIMSSQENDDRVRAQCAFEDAFDTARSLRTSDLSQASDAEQFAFVGVRLADYYCYSRHEGDLEKAKALFAEVACAIQESRWNPENENPDSKELEDSFITPLYFFAKARLEEEQH